MSTGSLKGKPSKKDRHLYKSCTDHIKRPRRTIACSQCGLGIVNNSGAFKPVRTPTVVIVGGGIGGTALALALQHRNIPCKILEKDVCFDARTQGYGLTMQQAATTLKRLGLQDDMLDAGIASESHSSLLPDGTVVNVYGRKVHSTTKDIGGNGKGDDQRYNLQLPRQDLRKMMLDKLNPSCIEWGTCVERYELPHGEHRTKLFTTKGTCIEADLVVGADGIYSKIRQQKSPDIIPRFLGVIVILGRAVCHHPLAVNKVFQTLGGDTRLYAMPFRGDVIMWQLSFRLTLEQAAELSKQGPLAMKNEALRRCGDWHDPVRQLLSDTLLSDITGYPALDLPAPYLDGRHLPCVDASELDVVLIGDAIHPMSPFKGQGANQALVDAWKLATLLASNAVNPIEEYEREMVARVTPKVQLSARAVEELHSVVGVEVRANRTLT